MPTLQGDSPGRARQTSDPYEAYFRYERRLVRVHIAIVIGAVLTVLALVSAAVCFHLDSVSERMADAKMQSASLN